MASRRRGHSGEDEATAIDMREASSKIHAALAKKRKVLASPNAPTRKAQIPSEASSSEEGPLHQTDDSGEEATEFLARPASSRSSSPAPAQPAAPAAPPFSPTSVSAAPALTGAGDVERVAQGAAPLARPRQRHRGAAPRRQRRAHGAPHHAHLHVAGGAAAAQADA
jgi:hypothetical protein